MKPEHHELSAPPAIIEATVHTPHSATVYRRAGRGAPVLLLAGRQARARLEAELMPVLAAHFLAIAPETDGANAAASGAAEAGRLRDLIDGLGLERPSIVVDETFGVAALGFAIADPERVRRLIVLCRDRDALNGFGESVDDALARAGHRFLLLRTNATNAPELLTTEARAGLLRFLSGEA
jgi:pimeloyl-ACP methyl ester carboxylesterase